MQRSFVESNSFILPFQSNSNGCSASIRVTSALEFSSVTILSSLSSFLFAPISFVSQRERAILAYKNAKISRNKVAFAARADSIARTGAPAERDRRLPFGNL
jgi:hypothetical protein